MSKIRDLRIRAQLSQAQLARLGGLRADEVSKLDKGVTQGRSARIRKALAQALELEVSDVAAYLDGEITLDALMPRPPTPPLDAALAFYPGKWKEATVAAARACETALDGMTPEKWARQLDRIEAGIKKVIPRTAWQRILQNAEDQTDE